MLLFAHQCKNNLTIFEIKTKFLNNKIIIIIIIIKIYIKFKKNKSEKLIKIQIIMLIKSNKKKLLKINKKN